MSVASAVGTAKLTVKDRADGLKEFEVDCPHGTTLSLGSLKGQVNEAAIVAAVVMKHFAEEGCACTAQLRDQYPPSLLPHTLWVGTEAGY